MVDKKDKYSKYINDFPVIIAITVLIVMIVFVIMYFVVKPYKIIHRNGYMVLSNNMTYNLVNNQIFEDKDLDVGVTEVENGDYIYKQLDSYFVGLEKKFEIDYSYPIYSTDGLTIYNINEDVTLIDRNFEKLKGYPGLSLSYGILYNEDSKPADDLDYLFLNLNNSIYINAQTMVVNTAMAEYTIPMHSPIYFNDKYINYYIFDGEAFKYNSITDIYMDSSIKIGDITISYDELLVQMGLKNLNKLDDNEDLDNNDQPIVDEEYEDQNTDEVVKPKVSVSEFNSSVFSISTELTIDDPLKLITSNPMLEIYTLEDKLVYRKRTSVSGELKLSGLSANTEYKIIGTYKYKNKNGLSLISKFYEGKITTKDINSLEDIIVGSELGNIYPNKIEIKDLNILNYETEAVSGIKKIVLTIEEKDSYQKTKEFNLSYIQTKALIKGEKLTIDSPNNLKSNSVYEYNIKFYDKDNNELKAAGNVTRLINTSKEIPSVSINTKIDEKNNVFNLEIETKNKDNVFINDYKYELYYSNGVLISKGNLDYENGKKQKYTFNDLNYNANYTLIISGMYDLEDGKGEQKLKIEREVTTSDLDTDFLAWYSTDPEIFKVFDHSISTDIHISQSTYVLEKEDTEVVVCLVDEKGNEILNKNGEPKFCNKYSKEQYDNVDGGSYRLAVDFTDADSNTIYKLKVKINVKQYGTKDITLEQILEPSITTKKEQAYVKVINKKLIGNNIDIKLEISDKDHLINPDGVIVEIYKGKFDNPSQIEGKYVYRNLHNISKNNNISIDLYGYTEESYTIVVSSDPYDNKNERQILYIYDNIHDVKNQVINVDKKIDAKLEMYEQIVDGGKYNTKIAIEYELSEATTNVYVLDCVNKGTCDVLGYFDAKKELKKASDRTKSFTTEEDGKNVLSFSNEKNNDVSDDEHIFYLVVDKAGSDLSNVPSFEQRLVKDNLYILASLDYSTETGIYNINSPEDFFDKNLIKESTETRKYAVTADLNFNNMIKKAKFSNFKGTIDFQGYSVETYLDANQQFNFFSSINKDGVLKNLVLNYHLNHEGVLSNTDGFIGTNYGKIENIIATIDQKHMDSRIASLGLLTTINYGNINNFVVYLNSDIHMYSTTSNLAVKTNKSGGLVSNGYITTNPKFNTPFQIILYESAHHGTLMLENYGAVRNVYSLVDAVSATGRKDAVLSTMIRMAYKGSKTNNTVTVATTSQNSNTFAGPDIYETKGMFNFGNNYYMDTNKRNAPYKNPFSTRIDRATLVNKGFWETVINGDDAFLLASGYYPILKMTDFMEGKQSLKMISFDYLNETKIDILAVKTLKNNIESGNGKALIEVSVSNPQKNKIESINIGGMTTKIVCSPQDTFSCLEDSDNSVKVKYDESLQISTVTLELELNADETAKSTYYINSIRYSDSLGSFHSKSYNVDIDPRVVNVEMYRIVDSYDAFVKSIDDNENIFLAESIDVYASSFELPKNTNFSSIIDGNEKYIDFHKNNISRGYFIYQNTGTIKNLQIKGMKFDSNSTNIGFVRSSESGTFSNIDISDSEILMSGSSKTKVQVAALVSSSKLDSIEKVSINNLKIEINNDFIVKNNVVGGIVAFGSKTSITNSYVYNLNIPNMFLTYNYGNNYIGGISGYFEEGIIEGCYTTGSINTEYSKVGGILGYNINSKVNNNYSYVKIISSGNDIGGIVGEVDEPASSKIIENNMFIGKLVNLYDNYEYSLISPVYFQDRASDNYALTAENKFSVIKVISNTNNLTEFDKNNLFEENIKVNDLPYLKDSSFVEQKIKNNDFIDLNHDNVFYEIYREKDINSNCSTNNNIINVNDSNSYITNPSMYNDACNADYIKIRFVDSEGKPVSNYEIISVKDNSLSVEQTANTGEYKLIPNHYLSNYMIEVKDNNTKKTENIIINLNLYKKIKDQTDWDNISDYIYENVIILNDITLASDAKKNKKIINLLGNGYNISFEQESIFDDSLINTVAGKMRDINFIGNNLTISGSERVGLIKHNFGTIENCSFNGININAENNYAGIISVSYGYIKNINLQNINVQGKNYVGSLVAYDNSRHQKKLRVSDIIASNIYVNGIENVGGVFGYIQYVANNVEIRNLQLGNHNNNTIYPKNKVGGIVGTGDCERNCKIYDSEIYASGTNIGGIGGTAYNKGITLINNKVDNLIISDDIEGIKASSSQVGGIYGSTYYATNMDVNNLIIGKVDENELYYAPLNSTSVGGVFGNGVTVRESRVNNSVVSGVSLVGGITGVGWNGSFTDNVVSNSIISSTGSLTGGIVARFTTGLLGSTIDGNIVVKSNVQGDSRVGGIIGYMDNSSTASQNILFKYNLVTEVTVGSDNDTSGGLIGYLGRVPSSASIRYSDGLFYGNCDSLIGSIADITTGSGSGYGQILSVNDFINKSNFKEYVGNIPNKGSYQINSVTEMKKVIPTNLFKYTKNANDIYYFPISRFTASQMIINEEDRVLVPYDSDTNKEAPKLMMMGSRMLSNYRNSYNNTIQLEYNLYATDVDKINIEFSDVDSNSYFYYEIDDYKSEVIPIDERTYTITYDFRNPIKVYVSNGYNYKESIIDHKDLAKSLSIINGKTYYIVNNLLYSENKVITGDFRNLYENKALTGEGKIYNITDKKEYETNIDYSILEQPIPLYETTYKDKYIKTYYNYSTVNNIIKDFQLFIKNGTLQSINGSLKSYKKDMYIIDFYNNNEIQITLKNDNRLYSIKNNIKYPSEFINDDIIELYTNIDTSDNIVSVKYKNGIIHTFDYRTGEILFDNTSDEYYSFIEYVKRKINSSIKYSEIESISEKEKYSEIELLKKKVTDISLESANDKISNSNNSSDSNENYVSVYNETKQNYDIYKVSSLLNDVTEIESETDKLYKNYELVQFYKTLGNEKKKNSINGIVLFTISIISVLVALGLLIRNKINKKGGIL